MQNVHVPLEAPSSGDFASRCSSISNADRKTYCQMASVADEAIGNVTKAFKTAFDGEDYVRVCVCVCVRVCMCVWGGGGVGGGEKEIEEQRNCEGRETEGRGSMYSHQNSHILPPQVVVIAGDNGGTPQGAGNNMPLRGQKAQLWEGGVRNNAIVWGSALPKASHGTVYDNGMVHVTDWHETFASLASAKTKGKPVDGKNVWDAITTGSTSPRNEFLINYDPCSGHGSCSGVEYAYREGDYKLLVGVTAGQCEFSFCFAPYVDYSLSLSLVSLLPALSPPSYPLSTPPSHPFSPPSHPPLPLPLLSLSPPPPPPPPHTHTHRHADSNLQRVHPRAQGNGKGLVLLRPIRRRPRRWRQALRLLWPAVLG